VTLGRGAPVLSISYFPLYVLGQRGADRDAVCFEGAAAASSRWDKWMDGLRWVELATDVALHRRRESAMIAFIDWLLLSGRRSSKVGRLPDSQRATQAGRQMEGTRHE